MFIFSYITLIVVSLSDMTKLQSIGLYIISVLLDMQLYVWATELLREIRLCAKNLKGEK